MAKQSSLIDMSPIDQLIMALGGKQILPGANPEQTYLARDPSFPLNRQPIQQVAPQVQTQQQVQQQPSPYNPVEEKAKQEAQIQSAKQQAEQQQIAAQQAAQAKIQNPYITPADGETPLQRSQRISSGELLKQQEAALAPIQSAKTAKESSAEEAQKQYQRISGLLEGLANKGIEYTPASRASTNEMQAALQKQLNELNLPPKEVDSMTEFLNTLAPVLLGGLVGGQAGVMAGAGGYQAGSKKLEDIRKSQLEERKAKLENLGKFSAGLGEIRKGEAEQAKTDWEIAKQKAEYQKDIMKSMLGEASKDAQFKALRPEKQAEMLLQLSKEVFGNQVGTLKDYYDLAIKEKQIQSNLEKSERQKSEEAKKEKRDVFKDTTALRKEFQSREIVKQWNDIESSYNKLNRITAGKGTGQTDLAIIFSYMKLLDPRSVVREGEQERAIKTGGIPDRIWAYYEQIKNGQLLSPEVRLGFKNAAKQLLIGHAAKLKEVEDEFANLAAGGGYDPSQIFMPKASKYLQEKQQAQPQHPQGMTYTPDVVNYAQKHGISNEQALQIKIGRGGK